jgi:trans-aconitate 2-methyltransferase
LKLKNIFEFDGKKYRKASTHQKEWGNKIIAELELEGNERILDLGCGDGTLTRELADRVPEGYVLGIDSSKGMIDAAKELEEKNLKFQLCSIADISFKNEFDLIFSNATLHWVPDHQKLLNDCRKALHARGVIRFNFAGDGNCSTFFQVVKQVMGLDEFRNDFSTFRWPWYMPTIDEYRKQVEGSNYSEINVWEENADRFFQNQEEMIAWIDQPSLVSFMKCLDDGKKQHFRQQVIDSMLKIALRSDGRCFETFRRINVLARK